LRVVLADRKSIESRKKKGSEEINGKIGAGRLEEGRATREASRDKDHGRVWPSAWWSEDEAITAGVPCLSACIAYGMHDKEFCDGYV
jgi:hypothetical protein